MDRPRYSSEGFVGHILDYGAGMAGIFVLVRYGIWLRVRVTEGRVGRDGGGDEGLQMVGTVDTVELKRRGVENRKG